MIMWLRLCKTWAVFEGQNEKKLPPHRPTEAANVAESILAEALPILCQGTLLKLGQALHETPFSNRNHKKKKWWFSVVFTQNQVMLCGSATFWLEARESSQCLVGSCFMFHGSFGFVSQTWNLGFRWGVQTEEHEGGMKSGADKGGTRSVRATPVSWVAVCSCFVSTFFLKRIICTLTSSLGFSFKEQNYQHCAKIAKPISLVFSIGPLKML